MLGKLIGLPTIPIYMLVGLVASPNTEWFPLDFLASEVELIAVFGLIFLLFSLGLEFDQDEFYGNIGKLLLSGGTRILINMSTGFIFGMFVGWGTREALIIAGMTAVSSSAIITKLLIETRRLPNRETPTILGVMVLEDVFIAIYLAIVSVILGGQTDLWAIVAQLAHRVRLPRRDVRARAVGRQAHLAAHPDQGRRALHDPVLRSRGRLRRRRRAARVCRMRSVRS